MKTHREMSDYRLPYPQEGGEIAHAKLVLGFYLGELARASNLEWTWKNQDEIDATVDNIVDGIVSKIREALQ
jgi:hypothetical protein